MNVVPPEKLCIYDDPDCLLQISCEPDSPTHFCHSLAVLNLGQASTDRWIGWINGWIDGLGVEENLRGGGSSQGRPRAGGGGEYDQRRVWRGRRGAGGEGARGIGGGDRGARDGG